MMLMPRDDDEKENSRWPILEARRDDKHHTSHKDDKRAGQVPAARNKRELVMYRGRISPTSNLSSLADLTSVDSLPLPITSPYTPADAGPLPDLLDYSPIGILEFASVYDFIEESSSPVKMTRTFDLDNISDFIRLMDGSMLPLCNRKSLEFETNEIHQLQKRMSLEDSLSMHLVENMLFLSFFQSEADEKNQEHLRFWDEDLSEAIKTEDYEYDADFHMYL